MVTRRRFLPGPAAGHRTRSARGTLRASARTSKSLRSGARCAFSHRLMLLASRPARSPSCSCVRPAAFRAARSCAPMTRRRGRTQAGGGSRCTRPGLSDLVQKSLPTWVNLRSEGRVDTCRWQPPSLVRPEPSSAPVWPPARREHPLVGGRAVLHISVRFMFKLAQTSDIYVRDICTFCALDGVARVGMCPPPRVAAPPWSLHSERPPTRVTSGVFAFPMGDGWEIDLARQGQLGLTKAN